ncbi:HK97 family phage prohead protease [Haloferax volcanii]|uniref:hypothetical protein n=1 Tax=Haloferax volcanii TaxID=2246 RepID=UPI0038523C59
MFERVNDRDFCEILNGIMASTSVDNHGHQFTKGVFEDWIEKIENDPQRRVMHLNHDDHNIIGEILDLKIVDTGDCLELHGKYGIYEGREDVLNKIQSGELRGLSVTAVDYVNTTKEEWQEIEPDISITTLGEELQSVVPFLEGEDVKYRFEVQKSIEGAAIISVAAGVITVARTTVDLWRWYQSLDEEAQENTEVTININHNYDISEMDADELLDLVKEITED